MKNTRRQAWFLVWPDGSIHPRWGYQSVEHLKQQAPGELLGTCESWEKMSIMGYGYARCMIEQTGSTKK